MKKLFKEKKYRQRIIAFAITVIAYAVVTAMQASGSLSRMIISLMVPVTCYIVAAIGLNLNVGVSGELNLGQAGFMAVGGFSLHYPWGSDCGSDRLAHLRTGAEAAGRLSGHCHTGIWTDHRQPDQ